MKKIHLIINVLLITILACSIYMLYINASFLETSLHYAVTEPSTTQFAIRTVVNAILVLALGTCIFLFNYRFNGKSLREDIAERWENSKAKKAEYKASKAEQDKQKRLAELQAEMDKLNNE